MLTFEQLDQYFVKNNIEVYIFGGKHYVYAGKEGNKWKVQLKKTDDGVKVEVETQHPSLYAAMYDAYERFDKVANKGAPNLLAVQLEHQPLLNEDEMFNDGMKRINADDDIPF